MSYVPKYGVNSIWFVLALVVSALLLFSQAWMSSPSMDEPAHLASGCVAFRFGDSGYFKVNPPFHKFIGGVAAELVCQLRLPFMVASPNFSNFARPEFPLGESVLELNAKIFNETLFVARAFRIPIVLLGGIFLWNALPSNFDSSRPLGCALWCFSPLVLAQGWVLSADALSGVMMCAVLVATQRIWRSPTFESFALSGFCWGLAIGTKFTFCPLYLAYPIITELCMRRNGTNRLSWCGKVLQCWGLHAAVALLTLCSLYAWSEVARPLKDHDFISQLFSNLRADKMNNTTLAGQALGYCTALPSPFPRAFLEGIDQQMADMDRPRGAYIMGTRLQGKLPWFFVVGYFMKEQVAVYLAIAMIAVTGVVRGVRILRGREQRRPWQRETIFCGLFLACFCVLMATQSNLVWNTRYLIPALPLVYILIAQNLPTLTFSAAKVEISSVAPLSSMVSASSAGRKPLGQWFYNVNLAVPILMLVMIVELVHVAPFHFSYINPLFGGSYRTPPALNDSNFDYGQDLFTISPWLKKQKGLADGSSMGPVYGLLSGHGLRWLKEEYVPASHAVLQQAIASRAHPPQQFSDRTGQAILIISRGLAHAEPWAIRYSTIADENLTSDSIQLAAELLTHKPDVFITPTIAVYYFESPSNAKQ